MMLTPGVVVAPLLGAVTLALLAGCGASARSGTAAEHASQSPAAPGTAAEPTSLVTIQASTSVAPALAQASPELALHPSATVYDSPPGDSEVYVVAAGGSGAAEYVDTYTVVSVCGSGIADDCVRYYGTPEYRIPIATGARFILLGDGMQPNRQVNFNQFRTYAAGPDGRYDSNNSLFEVVLNARNQAASLTAVYTP